MRENLFRNTAEFYDLDCRDNMTADLPFYLEYARRQGGEILELGCGTGRVALALAREGFRVTGLDLSDRMLAIFRSKLDAEPAEIRERVTIAHGNMACFRFPRKFSMIIAPFRAFQALSDDDDIAISLKCVRAHLRDGDGIFIVNAFNPYPVMDENWCYPERVQWERTDPATGNRIVKKHWGDRIDTVNQVIYTHIAYEVTACDGSFRRQTEDLKLKYYYRHQLRNIVERAGLTVNENFGWYDNSSPDQNRREIIMVCGLKS